MNKKNLMIRKNLRDKIDKIGEMEKRTRNPFHQGIYTGCSGPDLDHQMSLACRVGKRFLWRDELGSPRNSRREVLFPGSACDNCSAEAKEERYGG
jgi:hypothetical protein